MTKVLLLRCFLAIVASRGARLLRARASLQISAVESEPCVVARQPSRHRSTWCEEVGRLDDCIGFRQIEAGQGLCLDGHCYDAVTLRNWLRHASVIPHNRARFTIADLDLLLGLQAENVGDVTPGLTEILTYAHPYRLIRPSTVFAVGSTLMSVAIRSRGRFITALFSARNRSSLGRIELLHQDSIELSSQHVIRGSFWGGNGPMTSMKFSLGGERVATVSADGMARVWDAETSHELQRFESGSGSVITSVDFHPTGEMLVTGAADGVVRLWAVSTGATVFTFRSGFPIVSVACDALGRRIGFGSLDGTVRLLDVSTSQIVPLFSTWDGIACQVVAFSPDATQLAVGSNDGQAWILDIETGAVRHTLPHRSSVTYVGFGPDARTVLTGTADSAAQLWNAESGRLLFGFKGFGEDVSCAAFSPDGRAVVTGSSDGFVRTFHVPDYPGSRR